MQLTGYVAYIYSCAHDGDTSRCGTCQVCLRVSQPTLLGPLFFCTGLDPFFILVVVLVFRRSKDDTRVTTRGQSVAAVAPIEMKRES